MDIRPITTKPQPGPILAEKGHPVTGFPVVAPAAPVDAPGSAPSMTQITQAVQSLNKMMQSLSPDLEFSIDDESNRTIVKLVDQQTKEVIRQIPTRDTIEIAKALDRVQGLLIKQKA
jgi:flagellar protein FlaG